MNIDLFEQLEGLENTISKNEVIDHPGFTLLVFEEKSDSDSDIRCILLSMRILKLLLKKPEFEVSSFSSLIELNEKKLFKLLESTDRLLSHSASSLLIDISMKNQFKVFESLLNQIFKSHQSHSEVSGALFHKDNCFLSNFLEMLGRRLKISYKLMKDGESGPEDISTILGSLNIIKQLIPNLHQLLQLIKSTEGGSMEVYTFLCTLHTVIKIGITLETTDISQQILDNAYWKECSSLLLPLSELCKKYTTDSTSLKNTYTLEKFFAVLHLFNESFQTDIQLCSVAFSIVLDYSDFIVKNPSNHIKQSSIQVLLSITEGACLNFNQGEFETYYFHKITELSKIYSEGLSKDQLLTYCFDLLQEQDDYLINFMKKLLNIYKFLKKESSTTPQRLPSSILLLADFMSPHVVFHKFITAIGQDHSVLLDFLISSETHFLQYLLNYLKFLKVDYENFSKLLGDMEENEMHKLEFDLKLISMEDVVIPSVESKPSTEVDVVMTTLIRLKYAISKLDDNNLFPYNVKPLLLRIEEVEQLYEEEEEDSNEGKEETESNEEGEDTSVILHSPVISLVNY